MPPQPQQQQAHSRDHSYVTSAFSVYAAEVRKAIQNQQNQLDQLEAAHEQLQQTIASLEQLPAKLSHQVMVPMGKHAFFPGHLTHTNEIMVHLGDQYYVEVTAGHARGILQRKQAAVAEGIGKAQQQLKALQARLDVSADSLLTASGPSDNQPEAREIRSSLAESDALLASARKTASRAAAAAHATSQQQQQQPERVTISSGYSYTRPQGATGAAQRTAQQSAEDAALQARLDELMLLEQQQEQQEDMQGSLLQQQQDMQDHHAGLDTIQEGDEASEQEEAAAAAAGQLSAVHHLQQLEAESDSDDDETDAAGHFSQPQRQHLLSQQQQQQHAGPSIARQQQPLKSALKKGFLGPPSGSSSSSSRGSSSNNAEKAGSSTETRAQAPALPKPAAFTGAVVERPTQPVAADAAAVVRQVEQQRPPLLSQGDTHTVSAAAAAGAGAQGDASSSSKPMSKFKMRRLGLEPQADV